MGFAAHNGQAVSRARMGTSLQQPGPFLSRSVDVHIGRRSKCESEPAERSARRGAILMVGEGVGKGRVSSLPGGSRRAGEECCVPIPALGLGCGEGAASSSPARATGPGPWGEQRLSLSGFSIWSSTWHEIPSVSLPEGARWREQ